MEDLEEIVMQMISVPLDIVILVLMDAIMESLMIHVEQTQIANLVTAIMVPVSVLLLQLLQLLQLPTLVCL